MENLIYNFLLQSKFPRASILLDLDLLEISASTPDCALNPPAIAIVDPQTAQPLAVINSVDADDDASLKAVAIQTRSYAAKLAGKAVQGFVIRVNMNATKEIDQVQFFRIWPNNSVQQLTVKNFPDLDTLRVARKLADAKNVAVSGFEKPTTSLAEEPVLSSSSKVAHSSSGFGLYVPALCLIALVLIDYLIMEARGTPLLTLTQSMLVIGAALLFTVSAAIRFLRYP